jgi:hypothetical protein
VGGEDALGAALHAGQYRSALDRARRAGYR